MREMPVGGGEKKVLGCFRRRVAKETKGKKKKKEKKRRKTKRKVLFYYCSEEGERKRPIDFYPAAIAMPAQAIATAETTVAAVSLLKQATQTDRVDLCRPGRETSAIRRRELMG